MTTYDPNQQPWTTSEALSDTPARPDVQTTGRGDRWAMMALAVSLSVLLSMCLPGFSCLAPLIAGIVALVQAKNAVDPKRARLYGWIATGIGIAILVGILALLAFYGIFAYRIISDPNLRRP